MDLGDSESYLLSFYVNPLSHTMKGIVNVSAKLYSVLKRTIKSHFRFNRPLFQTLLLSDHPMA